MDIYIVLDQILTGGTTGNVSEFVSNHKLELVAAKFLTLESFTKEIPNILVELVRILPQMLQQ